MLMLGTVILHQLHKVGIKMVQWFVMILKLVMLCKTTIAHGIDQTIHTVQSISNLLVQIMLKLEHLLAHYLTTVVASIKLGTTHALHKVGQSGQQPVITVHQILQPALKLQSIGL
jgi:hypothetical protein